MRFLIAALALTFAGSAAYAQATTPDAFNTQICNEITVYTALVNGQAQQHDGALPVDDVTQLTGMTIGCDIKLVTISHKILTTQSALPADWLATAQTTWNHTYCDDPTWSQAIALGWTVVRDLTFSDGGRQQIAAECSTPPAAAP